MSIQLLNVMSESTGEIVWTPTQQMMAIEPRPAAFKPTLQWVRSLARYISSRIYLKEINMVNVEVEGLSFGGFLEKGGGKARCYQASHIPMLIWRAQHTRGVVPSEKWNINNTRVGHFVFRSPLFLDEDWHGNSRGRGLFWVPRSTRVNKFFAVNAFCASVTLWKIHVRAINEILDPSFWRQGYLWNFIDQLDWFTKYPFHFQLLYYSSIF